MEKSDWLNHPALRDIHPVKKEIMLELIQNAQGKSLAKMAPYLQQATKRMKEENLQFSKEEYALIIDVMTQNMSPAERKQFEMAQKILMKNGL